MIALVPLLLACAKAPPTPAVDAESPASEPAGPQPGELSMRYRPAAGDYTARITLRATRDGDAAEVESFEVDEACATTIDDVVRHRCAMGDQVATIVTSLDGRRIWAEHPEGGPQRPTEAELMQDWADGAGFFLGADLAPNQVFEVTLAAPVHGTTTRVFGVIPDYPCHYDDLEARCVRGILVDEAGPGASWRRWVDFDPTSLTVWRQVDHDTSRLAATGSWRMSDYVRAEGARDGVQAPEGLTLPEARAAHTTQLTGGLSGTEPPPEPPADGPLERTDVPAGDRVLPAWVAHAEGDAPAPALLWLEGGYTQVLFDPASGLPAGAAEAHAAGMTVMFPSQRGGHPGTGEAEGFLGEVDDVLAAAEHLATLPGVDPERIYLGGHSTGGTLALLAAASSDRWAGVVALGPVARIDSYGEAMNFVDLYDMAELRVRSPVHWMHTITSPTWVAEGAVDGNEDALIRLWAHSRNDAIRFALGSGHDHFSVVRPVLSLLAEAWVAGEAPSEAALARAVDEAPRETPL